MKERLAYSAVILVLAVALALSIKTCSKKEQETGILEQNIEALRDTTRKTKDLLGREQYEKKVYMVAAETLKKINEELKKELEANPGAKTITKFLTRIVIDSSYAKNFVDRLGDSSFVITFKHRYGVDTSNTFSFSGRLPVRITKDKERPAIISDSTKIYDFDLRMKVISGIKKTGNTYSTFARTDFPGVSFDLDGAVIDPETPFVPSRNKLFSFVIGPAFSVVQTNGQTSFLPSISMCVGLNLINF